MEVEMFPTEGQLWLSLLGIFPGIAFPALSFILWGILQNFSHLSAREAPGASLGQGLCTVTHPAMSSVQEIQQIHKVWVDFRLISARDSPLEARCSRSCSSSTQSHIFKCYKKGSSSCWKMWCEQHLCLGSSFLTQRG